MGVNKGDRNEACSRSIFGVCCFDMSGKLVNVLRAHQVLCQVHCPAFPNFFAMIYEKYIVSK